MRTSNSLAVALVALASLYGCAPGLSTAEKAPALRGCLEPRAVDTALFELVEDSTLVRAAVRLPDSGGVRCAVVYQLKSGKSASAYRVYGGKGWRFGRWWTMNRPGPDSTTYRNSYEICRAWNALDSLAICTLKPGTRFAIGPGQSAVCGTDPGYGVSDFLQAFFANPQSDLDIGNCRFGAMRWAR